MLVAATQFTAFHVIGALTAIWAVVLAFLGIVRHEFPPKGAERIVAAISVLLVVGSIGTAIGTAKSGPKAGGLEPRVKFGFAAAGGGSQQAAANGGGGQQAAGGATQEQPAAPSTTPPSTGGGGAKLALSADPSGALRFDKTSLQARAGTVTIAMANPAPLPHGVAIAAGGAQKVGNIVQKGGTSTVSLTLKPGTYTFYCPVPGHAAGGMKGTLTVR